MAAFLTASTDSVTGIAAALFTVGAVIIAVPAARFTIRSVKGMFN